MWIEEGNNENNITVAGPEVKLWLAQQTNPILDVAYKE